MKTSLAERVIGYVIMITFTVVTFVPLIGVIFSALTPADESAAGFAIPHRLDFSNFVQAWTQGNFGQYLLSSLVVVVSVVALTMVLAVPAGFAFARFHFPGSKAIFFVILVALMVPEESFIIPLYFDFNSLNLTNTWWALILPQTAWSLGFAVFWMRNYFLSVPNNIIEAARLDGARDSQVLWHIALPPARPAVTTACLLVGMWTWNEFLMPLIMIPSNFSRRTAPLALGFFQGQHTTQYSLLAAAGILVAAPIVILYLFLQRHFIAGMLSGAVKG